MSHWTEPERRVELTDALIDVAEAPLVNVFRDPSGEDQGKYPILAEAAKELEASRWDQQHDYNSALVRVVRRAVELLPADVGPQESTMAWREISGTLFGFYNADEASQVATKKSRDRFYAIVRRHSPHTSKPTMGRKVIRPSFEMLADKLVTLKPELVDESGHAATSVGDIDPVDVAELVAEVKEYWASPTAYSEFDLDTIEGVRDMYRQMMEDAARAVCLYDVPVAEVVAILRSNKARPDISGHDISEMTEQVLWSVERMRQILDHETGAVAIYGRVIDEQGNVVEGVRQVAGSSIRRDKDGEVVGDGPNLISDSEIDAWMRGVLEHAEPAQIAAGTLDAIRVLTHHVRVRLERSVAWQEQVEQLAVENPNDNGVNEALLLTERETKRQLAAVDTLRHAMQRASPAKVRCLAENVLWHDLSMGAAGNMNVDVLIERFRDDKEFKQYRR